MNEVADESMVERLAIHAYGGRMAWADLAEEYWMGEGEAKRLVGGKALERERIRSLMVVLRYPTDKMMIEGCVAHAQFTGRHEEIIAQVWDAMIGAMSK